MMQSSNERKRDFTQIPNVLLDEYELPESYLIGYLRLIRLYGHKDRTFVGSIRKLALHLNMSKSSTDRMIPVLVKAGLIEKDVQVSTESDREVMVIRILLDELWEKNDAHYAHTPVKERKHTWQGQREKTTTARLEELKAMPYTDYLQSPEWQQKRLKALRFARFCCQMCNSPERLNVHHRTYERKGEELLGDLIVLCNDCHVIFHQNRELS